MFRYSDVITRVSSDAGEASAKRHARSFRCHPSAADVPEILRCANRRADAVNASRHVGERICQLGDVTMSAVNCMLDTRVGVLL
jgi:hypothetical protein